jgi:drug/metabolite transporter (DMT)-like permease
VLLAMVLLHEDPSLIQLLGAVLILAGLVLATGRRRSDAAAHAQPEIG